MSTKSLRKWALLLTFWVAIELSPLRADGQTVSGDLTVTGSTDVEGPALTLGTRSDNSDSGMLTLYTDGNASTPSVLEFDISRGNTIWKWQQNSGVTPQVQMALNTNSHNELVLYTPGTSPVAGITLNPQGVSSFANSLTINGSDNQMPNQTLVNANSVLTESLADSRYILSSGYSIAIGFGSTANNTAATAMGYFANASGLASTAMGSNTTASGIGAVAMGEATTASGDGAVAMGGGTFATGSSSVAMGELSIASGSNSVASGWFSTASGRYSTASGYYTTASAYNSVSMGFHTVAQSYASVAMGRYNIGGFVPGGDTSWIATDPLLELGNGTDSGHLSDALLVDKSGNATFQGNLVAAAVTTTGAISAASVDTLGTVTSSGVVTAPTFVTTTPAGDIPMYQGN